jgi:hypothetical protein
MATNESQANEGRKHLYGHQLKRRDGKEFCDENFARESLLRNPFAFDPNLHLILAFLVISTHGKRISKNVSICWLLMPLFLLFYVLSSIIPDHHDQYTSERL